MSALTPTTVFQQIHAQQIAPLVKDATKQRADELKLTDPIQMTKSMANTNVQSTLGTKQDAEKTESKTKPSKRMWLRQLVLTQSNLGMMRSRTQGR
jgi:hypothetical protein